MIKEIYSWLEQFTGVTEGFEEITAYIKGDFPFAEPFMWRCMIDQTFERMEDMIECVKKHKGFIPDDLPDSKAMSKMITEDAVDAVIDSVNHVKRSLTITPKEYTSYEQIQIEINGLYLFIKLLTENDIEDIYTHNKFEKLDKKLDYMLSETFEITREDLSIIHADANNIMENYLDRLENMEESDLVLWESDDDEVETKAEETEEVDEPLESESEEESDVEEEEAE